MAKPTKQAPAHEEPFAEQLPAAPRTKRKKTKLGISEFGVDWTPFSDDEKTSILASLAADEETADAIMSVRGSSDLGDYKKSDGEATIEPKHVEWLLTAIEKAEQWLIPKLVAKKFEGRFTIDADVAQHAFRFDDEKKAKIIPLGVTTGNKHVPEKLKKALAMVGPGSEFLGLILLSLQEQQVRAIQMQVNKNARNNPQQNQPPTQGPSVPHKSRPNGKAPTANSVSPPLSSTVENDAGKITEPTA